MQDAAGSMALRYSHDRFRAAMQAVGVMWTNSADGNMTGEQPGWAGLTGQSQAEYSGFGWAAAVHPDDAQPTIDAWHHAVAERSLFEFEHRVRRHDGVWRRFAIRAVPVLDNDGSLREWVGVHIDITEAAADADALRAADRRKDEFLATLAHELRNPLAAIRTAGTLLQRADLPRERVAWAGGVITRQSQAMAALLDELLDLSRFRSGSVALQPEQVDAASLIESAVETVQHLIDAKGHRLSVQLPPSPLPLEVDRLRTTQVLVNLLTNAAKYTDPGGLLTIDAAATGGRVCIQVTDNGIGVAPESLAEIFAMFAQVRSESDRSDGGLGIGLTLAKRLVELQGGRIEARSEGLGRGSVFRVSLPLARDQQAPAATPAASKFNERKSTMNTPCVTCSVDGEIAVIAMNKPPVNGLGFELRSGIALALDEANENAAVKAIVLTGTPRAFSAGADVTEFGTPNAAREPNLRTVIALLENSTKPVVAAISGQCLGGGLELAMGAHFRVALADASLGLPEVKLGLLPGAGGTQRLPRLIGLEAALNIIVFGAPVAAVKFKGTPLIDEIIDGDLRAGAVTFARKVVEEVRPSKRARDIELREPNAQALLQFARNTVAAGSKNFPAPMKCVDAVANAAGLPFDEGLRLEREAFVALMATPESRALRHVFAAERAAAKLPDVPADTTLRQIRSVGVIGAGTMGGGITMNFLNAGLPVVLLETKQEALDKGLATIRKNYENSMKKGKLTPAQVEQRMALVTPTLNYESFRDVDLVIEAVFENMDVKQTVFRTLDEVCKPGAILASNTSYLNLDAIAAFTKRPQDVIGLHFFSPANVMRLLEVVRGAQTAPDVLATAMALSKTIKKIAVVSGVCDGFIGNRMLARYGAAANGLINAGALPQQIDGTLQKFGMAMGPFRMGDLAGLDIGWATRKRKAVEAGVSMTPVVADKLCEAGRFGQKTGAGWYRYEAGKRDPIPDAVTEQLIAQYRTQAGITPRTVGDDEIVERCMFALVNEGARILAEGIAARASDIDLVYLNGYGYPLHRGGPMLYADAVGLPNVVRALKRFAAEPGADASWQPAPLLVELAEAGKNFS